MFLRFPDRVPARSDRRVGEAGTCLAGGVGSVAVCVVAVALGLTSPAHAVVDAITEINVQDTNNIVADGLYDTETVYVPSVVFHENGLASYEALKAQAVAARTFGYFKMLTSGQTDNGTNDQVFVRSGSTIVNSGIWADAARDTWGEVLTHPTIPTGEVLASFYVAAALIDPGTPLTDLESGANTDPTGTEGFVTYNLGQTGTNVEPTSLGSPFNPRNRGAKSQNGADYLSDNSVSYLDILKHYYGADIQVETASYNGNVPADRPTKVFADFDNYGDSRGNTFAGHEGVFGRSPTFSGSTSASLAGSTADRSSDYAQAGTHSQKLEITFDETSGDSEWQLRHLAGAGSVIGGNTGLASAVGNVVFEAVGSVGFWLRTETEGLEASIAIDDPVTGDRGRKFDVIADGQWHKYQWYLDEASDWEAWVGAGNGRIDGNRISLDSLQFFGSTDATLYIDSVFWNPLAELILGDLDRDDDVDVVDLDLFGSSLLSGGSDLTGDLDGDGDVDVVDLDLFGTALLGADATESQMAELRSLYAAVPEPTTLAVLVASAALVSGRRRGRA